MHIIVLDPPNVYYHFCRKGDVPNLERALTTVRERIFFNNNPDDRDGAPDVLMIISAGETNTWTSDTRNATTRLQAISVRIIPVGIFKGLTRGQLEVLATDADELVQAPDIAQLQAQIPRVQELACQHRIRGNYLVFL